MPSDPNVTDHTEGILNLWTGSWIAALCIGVLVWGLIIWCVIVYRKRKDDHRLPVQLRYHLPLELLYTFVPIVMVGTLFYHTAVLQEEITNPDVEPDLHEIGRASCRERVYRSVGDAEFHRNRAPRGSWTTTEGGGGCGTSVRVVSTS